MTLEQTIMLVSACIYYETRVGAFSKLILPLGSLSKKSRWIYGLEFFSSW